MVEVCGLATGAFGFIAGDEELGFALPVPVALPVVAFAPVGLDAVRVVVVPVVLVPVIAALGGLIPVVETAVFASAFGVGDGAPDGVFSGRIGPDGAANPGLTCAPGSRSVADGAAPGV